MMGGHKMYRELDKRTAYKKDKPDKGNYGWSRDYSLATYLITRTLLSNGGKSVKLPFYEDAFIDIQTRGQFWGIERVEYLNASSTLDLSILANIWFSNAQQATIMRGYALKKGVWVQHYWLVSFQSHSSFLVETTSTRFEKYFGYAFTGEECRQFYLSNQREAVNHG